MTGGGRNLRIDRHECRKSAIEFLINHYDLEPKSPAELESIINHFVRGLDMEFEYYAFTIEILKGLLEDRKYMVIADRWIMGILDEHLQAELRVPDLSILRVAGYELLTHPEIPTTVVINEVNVLAKMYCPEKQSLIHATVNRMIETQISIGTELAMETGALKGKKSAVYDPMAALAGLDQQAQLAVILLEQRRRNRKKPKGHDGAQSETEASEASDVEEPTTQVVTKPDEPTEQMAVVRNKPTGVAVLKIKYAEQAPVITKIRVDASTQTVRDPTMEPGARIYRIIR
jgi:transcription termination factor NusB